MQEHEADEPAVPDPGPGPAGSSGSAGPVPRSRRVPTGDALPGIFLGDDPSHRGSGRRGRGTAGADQPGSAAAGGGGGNGNGGVSAAGTDAAGGEAEAGADLARRQADRAALAGFIPTVMLLPLTGLALVPFWAVANLVTDVGFWPLLVSYLLVGTALFFPSTQRLLLAVFFSARTPTPRELEILEPAWHNVLDAAGIPHDRYVLAISDSSHVEAVAAGGHIVAVSRLAMTIFPPDELEAALAHELGHHLGLHSAGRLASLWLEAPILLFARMGQWLELAAYALAIVFALGDEFGAAVGALVAGLGVRVAGHLVPTALGISGLMHGIRNLFGRYSTYYADQTAVDLGYGDELIELLERTVEYRLEGDPDSTVDQLLGGQSLVAKRIDRIEARLGE